MREAERSCRVRGNYSHLYKYFWYQGEPEQKCARKHGFERQGISWRLQCVVTGVENKYKGPSHAAQLAPEDVLAMVQDSLQHNSLGHKWCQVGDPCQK